MIELSDIQQIEILLVFLTIALIYILKGKLKQKNLKGGG